MTRVHADPVTVERGLVAGAEVPLRFCWRGRWYVVRAVHEHWLEAGFWWHRARPPGGRRGSADDGPSGRQRVPLRPVPEVNVLAAVHPAPAADGAGSGIPPAPGAGLGDGSDGGGFGLDDGECELWRVEAVGESATAAARAAGGSTDPSGVYDLRFEWRDGRWSLTRVHD